MIERLLVLAFSSTSILLSFDPLQFAVYILFKFYHTCFALTLFLNIVSVPRYTTPLLHFLEAFRRNFERP
jgi:hypothetical protein